MLGPPCLIAGSLLASCAVFQPVGDFLLGNTAEPAPPTPSPTPASAPTQNRNGNCSAGVACSEATASDGDSHARRCRHWAAVAQDRAALPAFVACAFNHQDQRSIAIQALNGLTISALPCRRDLSRRSICELTIGRQESGTNGTACDDRRTGNCPCGNRFHRKPGDIV